MENLIYLAAKMCIMLNKDSFTLEHSMCGIYHLTVGDCNHSQFSITFTGNTPAIFAIYPEGK